MNDKALFEIDDPLERIERTFLRPGLARTFHEQVLLQSGFFPFAGLDEAGRGPLAGPVVAAAVVLPEDQKIWQRLQRAGVHDSKQLDAPRREKLEKKIRKHCRVGVGRATAQEIDRINILQASLTAMNRAVADLGSPAPRFLLVDGNRRLPTLTAQHCLVKGDARSLAVGAASIVAKVVRDRLMLEFDKLHPGYGWDSNKGYPTPDHLNALSRFGPSPQHRLTFGPVVKAATQPDLFTPPSDPGDATEASKPAPAVLELWTDE